MGTCHALARHDDKKLFDLGKNGNSAVLGLSEDLDHDDLPKSRQQLWARIFRWEFEDYQFSDDGVTRAEVDMSLNFIDARADAIWTFIQGGRAFSIGDDAGDTLSYWGALGYQYIGSCIYILQPDDNREHVALLNRIHADADGFWKHQLDMIGGKIPGLRMLVRRD